MAYLGAGGQAIAGQRRANKLDIAARGHCRQPLTVAGIGEGGVRQAEQLAAVAGLVAVEHLRTDGHADPGETGINRIHPHPHRLGTGILLKHLFGAALRQCLWRIGVHGWAPEERDA
ncbi:hypothetical protein D3C73_1305600 [compost metagenome]